MVGYAYACRYLERAAYRWAADVSVYVAANRRGEGLGRGLYEELFERLRRQNFQIACAGITLPNDASVAPARGARLRPRSASARGSAGRRGDWHDVGWWQLELAPASAGTPLEPLPPG